jgi:hypothetical protein
MTSYHQQYENTKLLLTHHTNIRSVSTTIDNINPLHQRIHTLQKRNRSINRVRQQREIQIQRDNEALVQRITNMQKHYYKHPASVASQYTDIHNQPLNTARVTHKSLNYIQRQRERDRISNENVLLAKRIIEAKPVLSHEDLQQHAERHDEILHSMTTSKQHQLTPLLPIVGGVLPSSNVNMSHSTPVLKYGRRVLQSSSSSTSRSSVQNVADRIMTSSREKQQHAHQPQMHIDVHAQASSTGRISCCNKQFHLVANNSNNTVQVEKYSDDTSIDSSSSSTSSSWIIQRSNQSSTIYPINVPSPLHYTIQSRTGQYLTMHRNGVMSLGMTDKVWGSYTARYELIPVNSTPHTNLMGSHTYHIRVFDQYILSMNMNNSTIRLVDYTAKNAADTNTWFHIQA